jgi:hypothetical protein
LKKIDFRNSHLPIGSIQNMETEYLLKIIDALVGLVLIVYATRLTVCE